MSNYIRTGTFENLLVWQRGQELFVDIHNRTMRGEIKRDFAFRNQLRRASLSIPANVAEGFGRYSHKEFMRFLAIANGSAYEVRSHILLAKKINYLDEAEAEEFIEKCLEISRLIAGLRKSLMKKC